MSTVTSTPPAQSMTSASARPVSLLRGVRLEFRKARRKHLWLISFALLVVELAWLTYQETRSELPVTDYRELLFQLPILNAIFLPLLATVVASTICDIEFRANMLKELLVMEKPGTLYAAKWLACMLVLAVVVIVQTAALVAIGSYFGYGSFPAGDLALYAISTFAVCLFIATVIQVLSFFASSQFIPLAVGVALAFFGLFSMYLPVVVAQFVPSSYYALLSTVGMVYDEATRTSTFFSIDWSLAHFLVIVVLTAVVYMLSARAFSRKEL